MGVSVSTSEIVTGTVIALGGDGKLHVDTRPRVSDMLDGGVGMAMQTAHIRTFLAGEVRGVELLPGSDAFVAGAEDARCARSTNVKILRLSLGYYACYVCRIIVYCALN